MTLGEHKRKGSNMAKGHGAHGAHGLGDFWVCQRRSDADRIRAADRFARREGSGIHYGPRTLRAWAELVLHEGRSWHLDACAAVFRARGEANDAKHQLADA